MEDVKSVQNTTASVAERTCFHLQLSVPRLILCSVCYQTIIVPPQSAVMSVNCTASSCPCFIFLLLLQPRVKAPVVLLKPLSFHQPCFCSAGKGSSYTKQITCSLYSPCFLSNCFCYSLWRDHIFTVVLRGITCLENGQLFDISVTESCKLWILAGCPVSLDPGNLL